MQSDDSVPPPLLTPRKTNWLVFFAVLLAPPILTALTAMSVRGQNEGVSPAIGFFGGVAAGITCGIMLGLNLGRTPGTKVILSFLLAGILAVVCVTLSCFGCMLGGYQMSFH